MHLPTGMRTHILKTVQPHFDDVRSGAKRADLRYDDRYFAVGDMLKLGEYVVDDEGRGRFTGEVVAARVTHILRGQPWLTPGYCMMSFGVDSIYHDDNIGNEI